MKDFLVGIFWWLPIGSVPEVLPLDLKRQLANPKKRPNLIDVRTVGEWEGGHIAKTLNVPLSIIRTQVNALPFEKDKPLVVICRSATRSIPAVRVLEKAGFKDVSQLQGGMISWENSRYPVKKAG